MTPSRLAEKIACMTILAAAYFIAAKLGLMLAFLNPSATPIWPPTGIALAAFLVWGYRVWPGIFLGALLANLVTAGSIATSSGIAVGNTLEALVGAYLVNTFANGRSVFNRSEDVFRFVVYAAVASTMVSPTIGVTSLSLGGYADWADYGPIWLTWWLGDLAGDLIVAPMLVLWSANLRVRWHRDQALEAALLLLLIILVGEAVFGGSFLSEPHNSPLGFLCVPILVWTAFRFGQRETATAMFVLSGIAIEGTLRGGGPFASETLNETLLLLQAFLAITSMTAMSLAAAVYERTQTNEALQRAHDELENRVEERTAGLTKANQALRAQITERRCAEEALRISEARFHAFMDNSTAVAFMKYDDGRYAYVNRPWEQIFKTTLAEVVGKTDLDLWPSQLAEQLCEHDREVLTLGRTIESEELVPAWDGALHTFAVVKFPLHDPSGHRFVGGMAMDITERKQAEEGLKKSESFHRFIYEQSPIMLHSIDRDCRLITVSDSWLQRLGYQRDEVLGRESLEFLTPDSGRYVEEVLMPDFFRNGFIKDVPLQFRTKTGSVLDVLLSATSVKDKAGETLHSVAVLVDVTERKRAEADLRLKEEQFRQAQKMEAVGRLAGGVAHDFNNMLTIINGFSDILLSRLDHNAPSRKELESIKTAGQRAAVITRQLLDFSRQEPLALKVVNLHDVIINIEHLLKPLIGEDINLVINVKDEVGDVRIDPSQVEQVIMNLAVNARDAMSHGGRLVIESKSIELDEAAARRCGSLPPGPYVELTFTDTGCGIAPEVEPHIFEPFYTTKEEGKGTGLGLSIVYGIMKQNHGAIFVSSQPGIGTTFTLYFPISRETSDVPEESIVAVETARGTETVLIVEDEPDVRSLASQTLEEQGYTVLEARHGLEALLTSNQRLGPIQLLITDVVMPQMSGREVAERLLAERPGLRVIFMSGHTDAVSLPREMNGVKITFLQKPFSPAVLARCVREVLGAAKVSGKP